LYKDKVILNTANKAESCVVALSREDGRTLWKIPQQNSTLSYSTPLIREMAGRAQMIVCANKSVTSYNPDDGSLLWVVDGPSEEFVASPVYSEEARLVFISSSFPQRHLLAIRPDGSQNVTQSHILWRTTDGAPYVPSPIVEGDYLLTVNNRSDEAFCYEAATGKILWQSTGPLSGEKLGKSHSSPVSANGLIYFLNDDGVMNVVKAGPKFELVAQNKIGEKTYASPAISQNKIFIRGDKHLFCIGKSVAAQGRPTLFLIGDSTVKTGKGIGENGQWGWGSFLAGYFDATRITIDNRALGGRSSRTYQTEGLWDQVLAEIKPGDFVIMQFGHNDGGPLDDNKRARGTIQGTGDETREIDNPITGKKEIVHTYGWYMRKYITDTKAKSATPIVCSLIPRNIWVDGQAVRASNDYGKWAAKVANDEGALFIDLNEIIAKHYEEIGQEKVSTTFFGPTDHTHTTAAGAQLNTSSVVEELRVLKDCPLKHYLLDKPISSFQEVKNIEIQNP
jgi:lysophospholipase L1-like esterase